MQIICTEFISKRIDINRIAEILSILGEGYNFLWEGANSYGANNDYHGNL